MKNWSLILLCLSIFFSCKKTKIDQEETQVDRGAKTYVQQGAIANSLGFGGIWVTLYLDGKADLLDAGDIVYRGMYKITSNEIDVTVEGRSYRFEILSKSKISYNGKILLLKE